MPVVIPGAQADAQSLDNSGSYLGTPVVTSVAVNSTLTAANPTSGGGASTLSLNLANANTWTGAQGFARAIPEVAGTTTAGHYGVSTSVASAYETELTTTSATTILSFTPAANGGFEVESYFRVQTAATTVTLTYSWTDAGGAQTFDEVPATSEAVGPYPRRNRTIAATTAGPISVVATAGTANQVFVSANIKGV